MEKNTSPDATGQQHSDSLPDVLAGPLLRRIESQRIVMWLTASHPLTLQLSLFPVDSDAQHIMLDSQNCQCLAVGRYAHVHLIDIVLESPLPSDITIGYDLFIHQAEGNKTRIRDWAPHLLYANEMQPSFVIKSRLDSVLHGSCRKPHYPAGDGLVRADDWLAERHDQPLERPAQLLMAGDQVYADDVAGPMLAACHELIHRLALYGEQLEGALVDNSDALYTADQTYYCRAQLLPEFESNEALRERFFGGVKKPVFTTANASNHLISFAEMIAMYLLVWSPIPWQLIDRKTPELNEKHAARFAAEREVIDRFITGLPKVARLMAQLPTLMIFDDHDVTDDWNLTAAWEETAYGHPFSQRIIGNSLIAYLLCQAWGNDPDRLASPLARLSQWLESSHEGYLPSRTQDMLIRHLLRCEDWGYTIPSSPKLIVLDTRTRRWRSESNRHHPSGLMDWEALSELQQELLDEPSVVIVSPSPIFGVKLIEGVQKIFTWMGKPLLVDAENWMAHRGAASVMLNIFRHTRTPANYVVLSGDVHYSFVYRVHIRHREQGPRIWQITSSGLKNQFPDSLLDWFDRLNRWLYAPRSPLNWFTKRRRMHVEPYVPDGAKAGERLWNNAGIGLVRFDAQGRPYEIMQLGADERDTRFN